MARILLGLDGVPAITGGDLAEGRVRVLGQRGHDEGGAQTEGVGPVGGEGEARDVGDARPEGGLEERGRGGAGFGGVRGDGVVGEDFDGGGAVGERGPVEAGEVFGDAPVCVMSVSLRRTSGLRGHV